jgi:thioredoxin 1
MEGALLEFTDMNFNDDVLKSELPVVVDFGAEWCGPCKLLGPIVKQLADEYKGKMKIGQINVDDNPQTAVKYGIVSLPTVLFFNKGKIIDQHTGLLSQAALKNKIDKAF